MQLPVQLPVQQSDSPRISSFNENDLVDEDQVEAEAEAETETVVEAEAEIDVQAAATPTMSLNREHKKTKLLAKFCSWLVADFCGIQCFCLQREEPLMQVFPKTKTSITVFAALSVILVSYYVYILDWLKGSETQASYNVSASNTLIFPAQFYILWQVVFHKKIELILDFAIATFVSVVSLIYHVCDSVENWDNVPYEYCKTYDCVFCGDIPEDCVDTALESGAPWIDSTGAHNCGSFESLDYCPEYGNTDSGGNNANLMCCACGGGSTAVGMQCCSSRKDEEMFNLLQHWDFAASYCAICIPFLLIIDVKPLPFRFLVYAAVVIFNLWNNMEDRRFDAEAEELYYFVLLGIAFCALLRIVKYGERLYTISKKSAIHFPIHILRVLTCFEGWSFFCAIVLMGIGLYVKNFLEADYEGLETREEERNHYYNYHGFGWHGGMFLGALFVARCFTTFHDSVTLRVQKYIEKYGLDKAETSIEKRLRESQEKEKERIKTKRASKRASKLKEANQKFINNITVGETGSPNPNEEPLLHDDVL